jgi:beta-glucosidase
MRRFVALRFLLPAAVVVLGVLIIAGGFGVAAPGKAAPAGQKKLSSWDPQVNEVLARMTLEEKIGQMTQPDQQFVKDVNDVDTYHLGSILNGGDSDPPTNSLQDWTEMYDRFQQRALKTRLGIPLIWGVDAVHGHNNVLGAVMFPQNIGLGCTRDPKLIEQVERITAEEVRATGIHWTFAPCLTVPQDIRWGRTYEGFSESPKLVKQLGAAAVRGFQGNDLSNPLSVVACIKHFAGDGGTVWGTGAPRGPGARGLDQGDVKADEKIFRKLYIQGYLDAIKAGAGTIMPSYSSWNGVKCSGNRHLLTEILKDELGFEGFLISDYDAINQLPGDYTSQVEQSVNAGMDMFMVPQRYRQLIAALTQLVAAGKVPQSRIDDAVRRILRVKFAMGLMDKSRSPLADRSLWKTFGSPQHRQVARQAVRESLVLLKNQRRTLPISKKLARIHVAGRSADDIGNQCGGWTIRWQGRSGEVTPGGTTILKAIQDTVSKDTKVTFSRDGTGAEGANLGIVVVGEGPYAEGVGDRDDLKLAAEDVQAINNVRKAGIPVVVVLVSGRPMVISEVLDNADAFLAAWLPGTEGQGVADVLFGDYKPTGKLSFSWPRSTEQVPINVNQPKGKYDPLFKFGYGLSY